MISDQNHEMQLETTHSSGAEEWYCPTCGRRFLLNMPPNYRKIVLNEGDGSTVHNGTKGGLRMGALQISEESEEPLLPEGIRVALEKILRDLEVDD